MNWKGKGWLMVEGEREKIWSWPGEMSWCSG